MYCPACNKKFSSKYNLSRHLRESCLYRNNENPTKKTKISHTEGDPVSNISSIECTVCDKRVPKQSYVGHMRRNSHKIVMSPVDKDIIH